MNASKATQKFYPQLVHTIQSLSNDYALITPQRRALLLPLTEFVQKKVNDHQEAQLIFICTHNSRRSHIAQIWAQTAAAFFALPKVNCFSGGTEATAFNPRAVKALENVGFKIKRSSDSKNPVYDVRFSTETSGMAVFSKKYDSPPNPNQNFAAVMTCSHADENCPVVLGMEKRISLPYDDPKDFDDTELESDKYLERVYEIGREIFYVFSQVEW